MPKENGHFSKEKYIMSIWYTSIHANYKYLYQKQMFCGEAGFSIMKKTRNSIKYSKGVKIVIFVDKWPPEP